MAQTNGRIESLNMLLEDDGKAWLSELYGGVIANVEKGTISARLKNTDLSGTPTSGSVEAKRFANASSSNYGTARSGGKGAAVKVEPVTIKINVDKEIVEELEQKDVSLFGVQGVLEKRSANHSRTMVRELERAFFEEAKTVGKEVTTKATEVNKMIEEAIQELENTSNEFVDGVPRDMITVVCNTQTYGAMRDYLDTIQNSNVNSAAGEFTAFHGAKVEGTVYLPKDIDFIVMVDGAIAQPVLPKPYSAERIPLSNAYAVSLFYSYGTKAVMSDLILKKTSSTRAVPAKTTK